MTKTLVAPAQVFYGVAADRVLYAAPPEAAHIYVETDTGDFWYWDGTKWVQLSVGGGGIPGTLYRIWVIHTSGVLPENFPVTTVGLTNGLAVGLAGDIVWTPPKSTFATDYVVPAGVGLVSWGNNTIIEGQVTLGDSSYLLSMIVDKVYNQAGVATGVIGPAVGTARLYDTTVKITNNGIGDAHAVAVTQGGDVEAWGSDIEGDATGGGDGYGFFRTSGDAFVEGGRVRGSTAPFSGTVQEFSYENEIGLLDSGGALKRLYPADYTGIAAAISASAAGDRIKLPNTIQITITSPLTMNASTSMIGPAKNIGGLIASSDIGEHVLKSGDGCYIRDLQVIYSGANNAATRRALWIIGSTDRTHAINCDTSCTNVGSGAAVGLTIEDLATASECVGSATAASGTASGIVLRGNNLLRPTAGRCGGNGFGNGATRGINCNEAGRLMQCSGAAEFGTDNIGIYLNNVNFIESPTVSCQGFAEDGFSYGIYCEGTNYLSGGLAKGDTSDLHVTAGVLYFTGLNHITQTVTGTGSVQHYDGHGTGARVYNSGNINIPDNTVTTITCNSERYDRVNIHSTIANTGRLTAQEDGIYHIDANGRFASNAAGIRQGRIRLNGVIQIAQISDSANQSGAHVLQLSCDYFLSATDYVEFRVWQNSGGALNITASANYSPEFSMHRVTG